MQFAEQVLLKVVYSRIVLCMAQTSPPTSATPAHANVAIDGAMVRELRKLAGMTVTGLAKHCRITAGYLSLIERGTRPRVSSPVFARICDSLGVQDRRKLLSKAAHDG